MRKLIILACPALLFSCAVTSTNLQQARILGPANKSTVKITDSTVVHKTIVRSRVSINSGDEIRMNTGTQTRIDIDDIPVQNVSPENYAYKEKNLVWQLPQFQINLEAEATQKELAQTLGLTFCQSNGSTFLGGHAGVAYFQNHDRWAWRLGLNLRFTSVKYQINYIVETRKGWPEMVWTNYYQESDKKIFLRPEVAVTLNTSHGDWPVNYFISLTGGSQKFYDLGNRHDSVSYRHAYITLSAGIYRIISHKKRLVLGLGTNTQQANDGSIRLWHIIAQIDLL